MVSFDIYNNIIFASFALSALYMVAFSVFAYKTQDGPEGEIKVMKRGACVLIILLAFYLVLRIIVSHNTTRTEYSILGIYEKNIIVESAEGKVEVIDADTLNDVIQSEKYEEPVYSTSRLELFSYEETRSVLYIPEDFYTSITWESENFSMLH